MAPIDINNQQIGSITLNGNTEIATVTVNSQEVFTSGPDLGGVPGGIGYWPGDEGSGGTIVDVINGNNMSVNSNYWVGQNDFTGDVGIDFGGPSTTRTVNFTPPLPNEVTFMIRVRAGAIGSGSPYNRNIISSGFRDFQILYSRGGDVLTADGIAEDRVSVAIPQSTFEFNTWIVVMRINSSSAKLEVYDNNGNLQYNDTAPGTNTIDYGRSTLTLGDRNTTGGGRSWSGLMDPNLVMFNRFISDNEVDAVISSAFIN